MDKFNFIGDEQFRNNLENDYDELEKCLKNNCYKSVLILAGSIIEAILIDYLLSLEMKDIKKDELLRWDLNTAINKCKELNIITDKSKNLSDVVRYYRNLIHPGRSIRTKSIPEENDAFISKSLVEIIIKEIGERKQESYGYTAEQLLNKVEKDATSEVVWHHFLKKINSNEKRKLLLNLIPRRYLEVYNTSEFLDSNPEEDFIILRKFFMTVLASVDEEIKREVANRFISVLHEGSSFEVSYNIESFFVTQYFEYYSLENKQLVKEHLFGFIKRKMYNKLVEPFKGISKYLTEKELNELTSDLLLKSIQTSEKDEINPSRELLDYEYQKSSERNQKIILDNIDQKKEFYNYSPKIVERIQEVRDALTGDDLPF